jgi:hypothetical protein
MFFTLNELKLFDKQKWFDFLLLSSILLFSRLPTIFKDITQIIIGSVVLIIWLSTIFINISIAEKRNKIHLYHKLLPQRSNIIYWLTCVYLLIPIFYSIFNYEIKLYNIAYKLFIIPLSAGLLLSIISKNYTEEGKQFILKGLLNSIIIYVIFNIISLPIVGFRDLGNNILLEKIGYTVPRVSFWLNGGIDKISSLLIIGFVAGFIWIKQSLAKAVVLIFSLTIVFIDSRSIYLFLIMFLFFTKRYGKKKLMIYKGLSFIPLILPTLIYTVYPLFKQIAFFKERGGLLRVEIWKSTLAYYLNSSYINQLFGYGHKGYEYSGLSEHLREVLPMSVSLTPHNMVLIYLIDIGLIGCLLIFVCFYKTIQALIESRASSIYEKENKVFILIGLIAILSIGSLASIGTYYTIETSIILLSLIILSNISFKVNSIANP